MPLVAAMTAPVLVAGRFGLRQGRGCRQQLAAGEGFDDLRGFEADGDDLADEADDVLRAGSAVVGAALAELVAGFGW
ncbi:MAG TPA: hypothetical protein VMU04_23490 [Candidatus Acidoferrum sp.]|nr:hypothetical protein [Candidatus Acidoferrum sp.]